MTTSTYLNSIINILPAVQARNITDLLNELKVTGEVRNADEYRRKLQELSSAVNDSNPKPSFRQIRALIWYLTSADAHNVMMTSAKNDINAIFQQTDEIGEKVDDHHFLIMKNLAADMERGLKHQENTITRLEWLANRNNEFSLALVNSFVSSSLLKVPRSEIGAENLYFDNRTYKNISESELPSAEISEHGNKLVMSSFNEPRVLPVSVSLLTDNSSYGTQVQVDTDNDIENLIDGTRGTYWTRNVYLSEKVPKVTTVLEFNLGLGKDVNYVIVQGATQVPFFIESIKAIAPDGHKINLVSTQTEVNGNIRIDFNRVLARSIQITFSMKSYVKSDYVVKSENKAWDVLSDKSQIANEVDLIEMLGSVSIDSINSPYLSDLLNIPKNTSTMMNAYLYPFVLDNVWFGNSLYDDSSIFVSKPLKNKNFGICAVDANEVVTTQEDINNSIEYEIIKKDLSPKYKETRFPIPKLNQTSIVSERLIFTERISNSTQNDAGVLRFCPYVDGSWVYPNTPPVRVYKNGKEIFISQDFQISISLNNNKSKKLWVSAWDSSLANTTNFSDYTLSPQKMWIKINNLDPTAIYTVDYDVRTSDTYISDNTVWLDKDKKVFLSEGGKVYFIRDNPEISISSELYLQITMRRNTASQASTPELKRYALLAATYND